ncbi:MAG: hypothetical protein ICV68_17300 [Pyrinomonadaceae bacterium]|nr:hypothetical protein [Pyrinomonadaceae bacterium]
MLANRRRVAVLCPNCLVPQWGFGATLTSWLAPVAALLGVIVGGLLNAALTVAYERRRELAAARVAARLVCEELLLIRDMVAASLGDGRWGAILDPGLPYSRGLSAVEHRESKRAESAWPTSAPLLARVLDANRWEAVAKPYGLIDRTSMQFWTDDPERELTHEAREHLDGLVGAIPAAVGILVRVAGGARR